MEFGEAVKLLKSFRKLSRRFGLQQEHADEHTARLWNARLVQLAGESDVLLAFDFQRFQHLFRANSHFRNRHLSCHWTLCKSFETQLAEVGPVSSEYLHPEHACFYIHLRLYREIYRHGGSEGETRILTELERRLADMQIPAGLHASLGWTDILVEGYLPKGRKQLTEILRGLQAISYKYDGREVCPFQRTITRVGYRWDLEDEPNGGYTDPFLLRLRVKPGQLIPAGRKLNQLFAVEGRANPRIVFTEGKTDILMVPEKGDHPYRNIHINEVAREAFLELRESGVEYLESYLAANALTSLSHTELAAPVQCTCRTKGPKLQLSRKRQETIPSSIYMGIRRIYELLATALRDPVQCCDILPMATALDQSLQFQLAGLWKLRRAQLGTAVERYEWERRILGELSRWCEIAESVLDERTNETFHEIIAQSTRLGALRGNVQKLLLTGDYLVREFVDRAEKHLAINQTLAPPVFYYGATDEIWIRSGVVTIPGKYLFALPLSMPQMWQESGVWIFNQLYPTPNCPVTHNRQTDYIEREELYYDELIQPLRNEIEELKKSMADGADSQDTTAELEDLETRLNDTEAEKAAISPRDMLLSDIADHYADLMVRFFGFQNFRHFLGYSVTLVLGSQKYRSAPTIIKKQYWRALAQRLLFVLECEEILSRHPAELLDSERGHYEGIPTNKDTVNKEMRCKYIECMAKEVEFSIRHFLDKPAWSQEANFLDKEIFEIVAERSTLDSFYLCHWQYMWDFIKRVKIAKRQVGLSLPANFSQSDSKFADTLNDLREARICDLSTRPYLNAYFSAGYLEEVKIRAQETPERADKEPARNGAGMAALGRSIMLALFQRQGKAMTEITSSDG